MNKDAISRFDFSNIKATELRNNVRIYPPTEATKRSEAATLTQEEAVKDCMTKFFKDNQASQLSKEEELGRRRIQDRIKKK